MPTEDISRTTHSIPISRGFTKQSLGYDEADLNNQILQDLRHQVYRHVENFLKPASHILEVNAGTGIDAVHFVSKGHYVHATDISDGMINQIQSKISRYGLDRLTCQQLSYENLDGLSIKNFDYVFSNFGGLNCIRDLSVVSRYLPSVLKSGDCLTWVIMPPLCPSEWLWVLKGKIKKAFRRLHKNGTIAHVEGEYFKTYYHSLRNIRNALGPHFKLLRCEALAVLSPQPHQFNFVSKHPRLYRLLRKLDARVKDIFPFNRLGDHIVVTFQYKP